MRLTRKHHQAIAKAAPLGREKVVGSLLAPGKTPPSRTLRDFAVYEVEWPASEMTRHLVGTCQGEACCSSAVVIDVATGSGTSRSGRRYELIGEPGLRLHAILLWQAWVDTNKPTSGRDITEELWPALADLAAPVTFPGEAE